MTSSYSSLEPNHDSTYTTNEDRIMKPPPPPPNNIESIKKRRSTSLSPSLTRNKSPDLYVDNFPITQNTKERQVVFSDNVISHSPPMSPSSDDNAQIEEECLPRQLDSDQKTIEEQEYFGKHISLHNNISSISQSSKNGHRKKLSSKRKIIENHSDELDSTNLGYEFKQDSPTALEMCKSSLTNRLDTKMFSVTPADLDGDAGLNDETDPIRSLKFSHVPKMQLEHNNTNDSISTRKANNVNNLNKGDDIGKMDHINLRESPNPRDMKKGAHRDRSQKISSHNHKGTGDEIDPYNYVLESPKETTDSNYTNKKLSGSKRGSVVYRDTNEDREGIDDLANSKRNVVRPT